MQNNELKIDWIDFFRFIWSKKILIIIIISLGIIGGVRHSSDMVANYLIKLPYSNFFSWNAEDLLVETQGKWRSSLTDNLLLKSSKIKNLKDSGIDGFLIHETNKPMDLDKYIQELNTISSSFATRQYNKQLSMLEIYDTYSNEVKKTEYYAEKISDSINTIRRYESGVVHAFQIHHPDLFHFMKNEIGIVKDKNKKLKMIAFYVFISIFVLSLYLFIAYLREKR